jgi:hypothetical protein
MDMYPGHWVQLPDDNINNNNNNNNSYGDDAELSHRSS